MSGFSEKTVIEEFIVDKPDQVKKGLMNNLLTGKRRDEGGGCGMTLIETGKVNIDGTKMLHMEQNLSMDIVLELLKEESHTRAIAKKLGTNHMTTARRLKELMETNVVDYRSEGRNKVYHLKKSLEARNHVLMAEHHKLTKTLEKYPELRRIAEKIQRDKRIEMALIFGSIAKATAGAQSDIDLYIETRERDIKKELEMLNTRLNIKIGTYNPTNPLAKEMEKDHIILKGAEKYYEKRGFFR
ncbi:hypothetical protein BMS3Abin16_01048 [archaeon BMS3Abin16]|nr:hypothetical protein BMS3Abin16_01048 [archaeon BMS3Abin16]